MFILWLKSTNMLALTYYYRIRLIIIKALQCSHDCLSFQFADLMVDMVVLVDSLQKRQLKEQHEAIVHLKKEVKHMEAVITSLIAKVIQRRNNNAIRTSGIERRIDMKASRTGKVGRRRCKIAARTARVWKRRLQQEEQDKVAAPLEELIIIISLFAHSETMIVSIEHSKTHSMYKYNNYIQQIYITI